MAAAWAGEAWAEEEAEEEEAAGVAAAALAVVAEGWAGAVARAATVVVSSMSRLYRRR